MALPEFKDIVDLVKKGSTMEAQEKIMALREEHLSLKEELVRLREENYALREQIATTTDLTFDRYYYWRMNSGQKDGPFCQACWDGAQKLVRLVPRRTRGAWDCNVCNKYITDGEYSPPSNSRLRSNYLDY